MAIVLLPKSVELLTGHVTEWWSCKNLLTHGSVITTSNSTAVRQVVTDPNSNMWVTLCDTTEENQPDIFLGFNPLFLESSLTFYSRAEIDSIEADLLEAEIQMDLGEESLQITC